MSPINQSDAPKGYKAAPMVNADRPCMGCAFKRTGGCAKSAPESCMPYRRADEQAVVFVRA